MSSEPGRRHKRRIAPWVGMGLLALALLAVGLLGLEYLTRALYPDTVLYPAAFADDAVTGYRYRPGLDGFHRTAEFRYRLRTNSRGLRGLEFDATPAAGVVRVLTLGDSFTAGEGVAEDQAMAALLARGFKGRGLEVINAGVAGWGLDNELAFLAFEGLDYRPRLVVLGLCFNDVDSPPGPGYLYALEGGRLCKKPPSPGGSSAMRRLARMLPGYGYLAQHSYLFNRLRQAMVAWLGQRGPKQARATRPAQAPAPAAAAAPKGRSQAAPAPPMRLNQLHRAILQEMNRLCAERGIGFVVAAIPSLPHMRKLRTGEVVPLLDAVERFCRRAGIPLVRLDRALIAHEPERMYYLRDQHFTPAGQKAAARALANALGPMLDRAAN